MQDKDLDRLFSDKLGDMEVEPSRHVWKGISADLDKNKPKPLGIYLSIAASLLVMLTVGIWFLGNKVQVNQNQQVAAVKRVKKPEPAVERTNDIKDVKVVEPLIANVVKEPVNKVKPTSKVRAVVDRDFQQPERELLPVKAKPLEVTEPQEQLAQLPSQKPLGIKFTVPDKDVPLAEKIDEPLALSTLAANAPPAKTELAAAPVRKHKIRGIGDLLNAVVSKIDKRKDKLIEFSSKDEDEPNVTGLNLGFIKIKKQSR